MRYGVHFDTVEEAALFVGAWAGCVPGSREWKVVTAKIPGYAEMTDEQLEEAYPAALNFLTNQAAK